MFHRHSSKTNGATALFNQRDSAIGRSVGITTAADRALSPWANALIQGLQAIATERLDDQPEDCICGGR
jgi:hypothetical protein